MKFSRKVIVAVGLSDDYIGMIKPVSEMEFLSHSEIHFVHVFNKMNYTTVFGEFPIVYPVEADLKSLEESIMAHITKVSKEALPKNFSGKVILKCLFDTSPKDLFCDYVNEQKADLVIVPTRQKRGVFESSFAQFVNKHTHANMILLKTPQS